MMECKYTLSVEGGAKRSGFSLTVAWSVGPRSVAPGEPRMGWGFPENLNPEIVHRVRKR